MNQLISIIMPAYNAEKYIGKAIDSILNQTYSTFELLIADDASSDRTRDIVESYNDPRIKLFHNEKNLGYLKTCNKLMSLSTGSYITFQDADDYSSLDRFQTIIDFFNKSRFIYLVGSWSRYFQKETVKFRKCSAAHTVLYETIKHQNPFDGATICIRREVYDQLGGYKAFYDRIGTEDYDWLLRISEQFKVAVLEKVLYHVRVTEQSITRSITNPMQLISHDIALFCSKEREDFGKDSLENDKIGERLAEFIDEKLIPFQKDNALIFRRNAEMSMYNKLYRNALYSTFQAIVAMPRHLINYRTLFYVLRKANLKLLT